MKRLILILISCLPGVLTLMAETPVDLTETYDTTEDSKPEDKGNQGRRTAPAPIRCLIDFAALTVTGDSPKLASIIEYQLWSADGSICLFAADTDYQFVEALLSQLPGEYLIILKGDTYSLRGYILLP